jgi:PAS domain S-box-containing protein
MNDLPVAHEDDLLRLAFDLAPSGMLAVGPNGRILLANREAERMFGSAAGEMVGRSVDELVPPAFAAGHQAHRDSFFESPEARPMGAGRDLYASRPDGSYFPVEIGLKPVRLPTGVVVVATVVDITQRRAAELAQREVEERARQTQKLEALGTLAGGIAHDFNNILLGIVGYTELAQRALAGSSALGTAAVVEDLDQVLRAAERGRQLVRRILMFTRHAEVTRTPLSLDRVVTEAADLLRASLPATIQIRLSVEPGLPPVLADETLVHQVVLNLGTNAAHAMERGGVLGISLAAASVSSAFAATHEGLSPGRHVRLTVVDDGTGMSPEVRARLFEPFFTTKPVGKGTGLGLSVILGIVQSLDGGIEITSELGKGTRVDVWLPVGQANAGGTAVSAIKSSEGGGKLHALFVEDEPALAAMERRQIEALGFRVTVHTSSEEALEDFRARPEAFDLMVTDNTMPRMTGLELSKAVTTLRPQLPVLMVSGYADNAELSVLLEHGVRAVLQKPHTAAELGEALRRLLDEA